MSAASYWQGVRQRVAPGLATPWWTDAAARHIAADEATGRPYWQCACGPCRVAREEIAEHEIRRVGLETESLEMTDAWGSRLTVNAALDGGRLASFGTTPLENVWLDADEVTKVRDWLTRWLDARAKAETTTKEEGQL